MKKKSSDAWSEVKKSMTSSKKVDWMTKEKKKLSKVKPIKKK
jgi:hypothetical protein